MNRVLRLCLDLNIWCAALLADFKGRQGTSCQSLVEIVQQGACVFGEVQLIISWGMLNRLQKVLERDLKVSQQAAANYIEAIRSYAEYSPQLTLAGTGVIPIGDDEDAHVLETALAGKATVLVTANFKDFISKDTQVIVESRHAIHTSPTHILIIAHPYLMTEWLRLGKLPT